MSKMTDSNITHQWWWPTLDKHDKDPERKDHPLGPMCGCKIMIAFDRHTLTGHTVVEHPESRYCSDEHHPKSHSDGEAHFKHIAGQGVRHTDPAQ